MVNGRKCFYFEPTFDCSYFIIARDNTTGCADTSFTYNYGAEVASGEMSIYPNPTTDRISARFDNYKNQVVKFDLINNEGVKVDEYITSDDYINIDLSNYRSGVYYLSFNSTNNSQGCIKREFVKSISKIILNK